MSSTAELTPASVIAQAIVDIVTVGSQELREECLRASGHTRAIENSREVTDILFQSGHEETESDLHDFSSADEELIEFSTTIADDGFHTPPPADNHLNADPFSPPLGLLSPRKTSVHVNDDDFSQDECDPFEKQVEQPLQKRCIRNLQTSGFVADDLSSTNRSQQVQAVCEYELSDFSD